MRKYFSQRNNKEKTVISLDDLKKIFLITYDEFYQKSYFSEFFGFDCTDGYISGKAGENILGFVIKKTRKSKLWPITEKFLYSWNEEDLFDGIEFLFDCISKPIIEETTYFHQHNGCGYHCEKFDKKIGENEFRQELNDYLRDYEHGYELSDKGEVAVLQGEFEPLLKVDLPICDPNNIENRVKTAIEKFRRRGSSLDDKREAVRELADVLEFLKIKIKENFAEKDRSDLFNIINNFGIRHHNSLQKNNYDKNIWLSWMFWFFLATIHAVQRLQEKK